MKKILLLFLSFICFSFSLFSFDGVLSRAEGELKVLKTEYFDIIYEEESFESAKKIFEVCDSYYINICSELNVEPYQRFPVTITRQVELMNAYFAQVPYNRIVLYDYPPEDELAVFDETITSVFYHELTHAVTFGIKAGFWKGLSFFSDAINPANLSLTTFWSEGATVSFESKGSGGRLNDPFFTQMLNIARAQEKFPSWRDVTGSRDTTPGGTDAYTFGGAFAAYLQDKYGMEKYGQFWKNAGTITSLSFVSGIFKKTYGRSVSEEWEDFIQSVPVLSSKIEKNFDLVSYKKAGVELSDSYYDSAENKLTVVFYDRKAGSVFKITADSRNNISSARRLFSVKNLNGLRFSGDGKKLFLERLKTDGNVKVEYAEFSLDDKKYRITQKPENFMKLSDNELTGPQVYVNSEISACIVKNGLKAKFRIKNGNDFFDLQPELLEGDGSCINARNLHLVKTDGKRAEFVFVWTYGFKGLNMLSRLGKLVVNLENPEKESRLYLLKTDGSTGYLDGIGGLKENSFFVTAWNYDTKTLHYAEFEENQFEIRNCSAAQIKPHLSETEIKEKRPDNLQEREYNAFEYFKNGVFIPLGITSSYNFDFSGRGVDFLGATFVSSNPWSGSIFILSGGLDPYSKEAGLSAAVSGGNDSLTFSQTASVIFTGIGFDQVFDDFALSYLILDRFNYNVSGGINNTLLYGNSHVMGQNVNELKMNSAVYVDFSNIRKIYDGVYRSGGIRIQPRLVMSLDKCSGPVDRFSDFYINGGLFAEARVPFLIEQTDFSASIFPERGRLFSGTVSSVLFSHEIQKGIPAISVFVNRFTVTLSYTGQVVYLSKEYFDVLNVPEILKKVQVSDYHDELSLSAYFTCSLNTGFFAGQASTFYAGFSWNYRFHEEKDRQEFGLTFKVGL